MNDHADETVEADTPEHLRPMPEETVNAIVKRADDLADCLNTTVPDSWIMQLAIDHEARPFAETHTPHDAKRLANCLNYVAKELCRKSEPGASGSAQQIAADIEAAVEKTGNP